MAKAEGTTGEAVKTRRMRYTPEENEMLFEMWWDPVKRRELPRLIGRNLTALRSQFCRLLKEKGISNDDYYRLMGERHGQAVDGPHALRRRIRANNEQDEVILEVFAKHHALGNTKTKACEELRRLLKIDTNNSALKLRFYRLMNRRGLTNQDLVEIGRKVLARGAANPPIDGEGRAEEEGTVQAPKAFGPPAEGRTPHPAERVSDLELLSHLGHLPREVAEIRGRLEALEEAQRHQLDLRGFIEHLLAVERDLKEEDRLKAEIRSLHEQNYQLTQEMAAEKKRLRAREEELEEIYQLLNNVLHEFMHLESVAKLASLGDFIHRLEVTVDQFGNVLRCRRV
ncbi:MAG: hypothetical protein K6U03_04985 [Firmicutes bacterium]|nr:hypothetical protein [Bacillota bacterium]